MGTHKMTLAKLLGNKKTVRTNSGFSNSGGSDLVDTILNQISDAETKITTLQQSANSYKSASDDWMRSAYADWKYSEQPYRLSKNEKSYGTFKSECQKISSPCVGQGETGVGGGEGAKQRYNRRYEEAISYLRQSVTASDAAATTQDTLDDLKVQLQDAQDAANRALAAGLSQENADALLQAELEKISAETQNILANADNILADTRSEEESPNKKIFIFGGIALTLLAGFLLYRKFAK